MKYAIEYSIGRYRIRFNFWYLIIFLVVQTMLNELGFWQLNRAKEKQQRIYLLEKGGESAINGLSTLSAEQRDQFQSVDLQMELIGYDVLLLDNKIHNHLPGYHVLNIARDLESGKTVLVNRGWVSAGAERSRMPSVELPNRSWHVKGRIYPITDKAISTASASIEKSRHTLRLPVLDLNVLHEIEKQLGVHLESYVLRLNSESEAAFETDWVWTNMPPEKHLAYAIQWFALALVFLLVSLVVSIKKGD